MSDDRPIERLNYFNGQQLAAADFRAEQDYHIAVRRLLNRSLYSPGVAAGLEVSLAADQRTVLVDPGVALDEFGREIILRRQRSILAVGLPSEVPGVVYGNYLALEYAEQPVARLEDGCAVRPTGRGCRADDLAWGGPTRLREEPQLRWRDTWPRPGSGQIVIAQAELDAQCKVARLNLGVRKSASPARARATMAYALEGEADLDTGNPKQIIFHIRRDSPESVVLYLRGALFSTLYYSELGAHNHTTTITLTSATIDLSHSHPIGAGETKDSDPHTHGIWVDDGKNAPGVDVDTGDDWNYNIIEAGGVHKHSFDGLTTTPALQSWTHSHQATGASASAGAPDRLARTGASLKYLDDLQILHVRNGTKSNITPQVLAQLRGRDGPNAWDKLGNGKDNHSFVTAGTGEIDLTRLGLDFGLGEHQLVLSAPAGGGRVHYNLYVE